MRKLAAFAFSFSAAVLTCNYLLERPAWLFFAGVFAAAFLGCFFLMREKRRLLCCLLCAGFGFGFLWMRGYDAIFFQPARELDDQTVRLSATVLDYPTQRDYGWQVSARMETESGTSLKILLYTDEQGETLRPGDRIESVAHLTLGTFSAAGEEITYYTAKGIFLWGQCYGTLRVQQPGRIPVSLWPAHLAYLLKKGIDAAFPEEAAAVVRAVVTGSRDKLTDQFTSSLERTGLSHTVAVSGMHLSCFAGILALVLGRGRRSTAAVVIFWALLFSGIAGSTPSVSRAAVMIVLLQIAPLLRRERDDATALAFALMLLMLWNPYSAAHVGLQLSFAAVSGILIFAHTLQNKICKVLDLVIEAEEPKLIRMGKLLGRAVVSVLSATLGAMVTTVPLTALHFGTISLIAPLANLLTLWAITLIFAAGLLTSIFGFTLPALASSLSIPVAWLAEYVAWCSDLLSKASFASLTLDSLFYRGWLILFYIVLVSAFLVRGKRRYILPGCCLICALCLSILCTSITYGRGSMTVTALDVGQGQSILLRCGDRLALVDCGGDGYDDPGDIAADYIQSRGRGKLDFLILTHYHDDHANGIAQLLNRIPVKTLFVPDVDADDLRRQEILKTARERDVEIYFVEGDTAVDFYDGSQLMLYPPLYVGADSNELGLSVLATAGEENVLITGDMGGLTERMLLQYTRLPDIELLIAGHHGSKNSTTEELLAGVKPEVCIISVGEHNYYGHPAAETLQRLENAGTEVYRTDQRGTISVTFNKN